MEETARESFRAAVEVARGARRTPSCSPAPRSATPARGRGSGGSTPAASQLLEEALASTGEAESPLRARLLARLGLELYYAGEPERRLELTGAGARRSPAGWATRARWPARSSPATTRCGGPETVEERLAVAAELRRVAEETGDPELELEGAGWTVVDLLELGDVQGADIQIAAASKLAEALHRPLYLWWTSGFRCARAQLDGRLRRGRAARRRRRSTSAAAARPRTRCTTTRRRSSTSAASRGAWPRSRTRCAASSSSTRRSRRGARGSRSCWPSSGGSTRRARCSSALAGEGFDRCRATPTG